MFANERGSVRLLLGVFSLHNWEEVSHLPQDLENLPPWARRRGPWEDRVSFATATTLLTAIVSALSKKGLESGGTLRAVFLGAPSAALIGNALSHVGRAVVQRRYNGGLITAPFMGATATHVFFLSTRSVNASTRRQIFLFGNIAAFPAILGSLYIGRVLTHPFKP